MIQRKMHKKGSIIDMFVGIALIFIVGIGFLIGAKLFGAFRQSSLMDDPDMKAKLDDYETYGSWTFDFVPIMAFMAFYVGAIVLAVFARHHPIFAYINILLLIALFLISVPLSNSYTQVATDGGLGSDAYRLGVFGTIMDYLPTITIIFAVFLILAMFAFKSGVSPI